jgi:hypothetical protein
MSKRRNPEAFAAIQAQNTDDKLAVLNAAEFDIDALRNDPRFGWVAKDAAAKISAPFGFEQYGLPLNGAQTLAGPNNQGRYALGSYMARQPGIRGEVLNERIRIPGSTVRSQYDDEKLPRVLMHELTHMAGADEADAMKLEEHFAGTKKLPDSWLGTQMDDIKNIHRRSAKRKDTGDEKRRREINAKRSQ